MQDIETQVRANLAELDRRYQRRHQRFAIISIIIGGLVGGGIVALIWGIG